MDASKELMNLKMIGSDIESDIYNAYDDSLNEFVIVRKYHNLNDQRLNLLKREFELVKKMNHSDVIKMYKLFKEESAWCLVFEDFKGSSLFEYSINGTLTYVEFLNIAISLSNSISRIHEEGISHFSLNPKNIILNRDNGKIKIKGLEFANKDKKFEGENLQVIREYTNNDSPEVIGEISQNISKKSEKS